MFECVCVYLLFYICFTNYHWINVCSVRYREFLSTMGNNNMQLLFGIHGAGSARRYLILVFHEVDALVTGYVPSCICCKYFLCFFLYYDYIEMCIRSSSITCQSRTYIHLNIILFLYLYYSFSIIETR